MSRVNISPGACTEEQIGFSRAVRIGNNIAECKFWAGESGFLQTIDQILGYLSWRDTKASILLFVENKNFTKVELLNKNDDSKKIDLTVMAFRMPS